MEDELDSIIKRLQLPVEFAACYRRLKTLNLHSFCLSHTIHNHFSTVLIQIHCNTVSCKYYGCNSSSSGAYYWNTPTDVYSYITNVSAVSIGSEVFNLVINDYSNRTLYVPYGTSAEYQADTKWSQYFGSIVEMNGPSGDMNGDGTISIRDVTTLIDYLLGAESGSFSVDNADVNGDGQITIADATALIDMLL